VGPSTATSFFSGGGGDDKDPKKPFSLPKGHYDSKPVFKRNLRKSTKKQSTSRELDSISSSKSTKDTRQKRKREELVVEYENSGILNLRPIPPRVDRRGRTIWSGHRDNISWYPGFLNDWWNSNGPKNHTSCVYHGGGGCSGDMQVDHVRPAVDYILNGAGVGQELICDGTHHWNAYVLDDAVTVSSSHPIQWSIRDTIRTAYHHENNLQAMCGHHNESKGSRRRGLDDPHPPEYVGLCNCEDTTESEKKVRRKQNDKDVKG
jgi:hypothetical protein